MLFRSTECVLKLHGILDTAASKFKSKGLLDFHSLIKSTVEGEEFQALLEELPKLKHVLENISSVTIGINVNYKLQPQEAVFLSVQSQPFKEKSVVSRLFGLKSNEEKVFGISQFYSALKDTSNSFVTAFLNDLGPVVQQAIKHLSAAI